MITAIKRLHDDSLFRNSFYLILATGVMAGFGFFFWLISARVASVENIGIATVLITSMNMISIFSLIGFDSAIIRFLVHSKNRNGKLNTGIILVGLTAIILSILFIFFVKNISPQLSFIKESLLMEISFVVFCSMSAINILTDAVFLAHKQAKFSFIINTIFSFIKMLLPLAFISYGAFGIFSAAAIGQGIGFILSIAVMIWKFDYKPEFTINFEIIKDVWHYCIGSYVAGTLNLIPITLLPIIITNNIGAKEAGYFYIVMMIGNLLYAIPHATTRSFFAEGSSDEENIHANIIKTLKVTGYLLLPSIAILLVSGQFILNFFGKIYSTEGIKFLYIIAVSGIAVSTYSLTTSIFKIKKKLFYYILTNMFYAGSIIYLAYMLMPFGLVGIGYSWLAGNILASLVGWLLYKRI